MKSVKIITDSCADLAKDVRLQYDIDYVKMNIVHNGTELPASLDWDLYTPKQLYDWMRGGDKVTTTQVPMEEFLSVFSRYVEVGMDIVYIACAEVLSGSVCTGAVAAKQLMAKHPDRTIRVVDAKNSCLGEGMLAIEAAKMAEQGLSADEIATWLTEHRVYMHQWGTVDTLEYLKRAGRVKASSAFFGNLFGVRPIIISDTVGQNTAIKKVKGRKSSMDEIVRSIIEVREGRELPCTDIWIGHADAQEDALYLQKQFTEKLPEVTTHLFNIGPIIGASVGPGTVALYSFGCPVTHTA